MQGPTTVHGMQRAADRPTNQPNGHASTTWCCCACNVFSSRARTPQHNPDSPSTDQAVRMYVMQPATRRCLNVGPSHSVCAQTAQCNRPPTTDHPPPPAATRRQQRLQRALPQRGYHTGQGPVHTPSKHCHTTAHRTLPQICWISRVRSEKQQQGHRWGTHKQPPLPKQKQRKLRLRVHFPGIGPTQQTTHAPAINVSANQHN